MAQSWDLEWFYFADLLVLASGRQVPCDSISQSFDATRKGNSGARAQLEFANKLIRESISRTTGQTPANRRLAKAMRAIIAQTGTTKHDRYGGRYQWKRAWGHDDSWGPEILFYDASQGPIGEHNKKKYFETFVDDKGIHLPWPTPFFALRPFRAEIAILLGINENNLPAPPSYDESIGFNTLFFAYEDIAMPDDNTLMNFKGLTPRQRRNAIIAQGKILTRNSFNLPEIDNLDFPNPRNMPTDHAFLSKRDSTTQGAPWALVTGDDRYVIEKSPNRDNEFVALAADFPCDQFSEAS